MIIGMQLIEQSTRSKLRSDNFEFIKLVFKKVVIKLSLMHYYFRTSYDPKVIGVRNGICIASNYINQDYINVSNHAFISERLKNKILIDGITGIALNDQCELLFD
jgi:hypothetical protein